MSDEDLLALAKSLKPDERPDKLRGAINTGLQFNPDEYAKAIQLSAKTGVVPTAVMRDMKAFEAPQIDHTEFVNINPKTADWLISKVDNAAIAHDDLEVLTGLETASEKAIVMARNAATVRNRMMGKTGVMAEASSAAARVNKGTLGTISSVLSAAGEAADFASYSVQELVKGIVAGPDAFDRAMRNITSVRPSEIGGLGSAYTQKIHDPLIGVFESGMKARAPLMVQLPDGSTTYNWKEIGAYWDLIAENAPQLATQWGASVKAFNVAKMAGATDAVAAAKAAAVARPIEWSQSFAQEMEATRKKDVPMRWGLATAAASSTAQTMISQGLPGGKGGLDALLFRRIAESTAGKKGISGAIQRGVLGAIKEGTEEAAQEGVSTLGQRTYDPNALQGATGRILTAAIGGALVGGPMASIAFRDNVREISDLAAQSKLKARDAEAFAGFMKEVGGEAFIDANKLTTFFQENGIDPIQGAEMIGARNYAEAMVAGTDAVVSVGDMVSKLKPEQVSLLADDMRVAPGELSAREVEDYQDQTEKIDLEKSAEPIEAGPRQVIAEDTYRQLVDAGMAPRVAEVYADRHARVMENLAKDYGQDPIALNERYGLRIMRVDPSVAPVDAVLSDGSKVDLTSESGMEAYLAENPEADPLYWQSASGDGSRAAKMSARMRKLARTTRAAMDKSMAEEALANEAEFAAFDEAVKNIQAGDILDSKRGFIQFSPSRKVSIAFLENADLTTFIHETGHMYLEVAGDLAQESPESEGAKQYGKILDFLGVESRDAITREHQEKFAEAMEVYAMEGKAPTPELKSAFQRVKYWMIHVYRSLNALNVKLNDEIRGVFDRMIAGDDAVSMTEKALEMNPMFANAEDMNATQAEFDAYSKMAGKATMTAREAVEAKLMRELMREREIWWEDELAKVSDEVAAELETAPGYVAFRALTQGEDGVKLSKQSLLDAGMTQEDLNALPRSKSRVYSLEGGMDPQAAAEVLGFQNGDELLDTLRELKPFKEQVKEVAEARMKEKHGDMMNDGTIADEAIEAVHNGHYADLRMAELRVLDRMRRKAKPAVDVATKQIKAQAKEAQAGIPPIQSFRDTALEVIERTAIRDIQPHRYLQARVRASRDAAKAYTALDFEAAAEAKRREILNHFLYLEASKAREESTKIAEYARNATDKKFLQRLGKAGADYLGQWLNLAGRYDFTQISKAAIDQNIRDWAASKEAEGIVIDPMLFDESRVKNWREIPIAELRALRDALVNIETVARRARKVIAGDKQVDYETAVGDLVSQAYGNFKAKALPLDEETRTYVEKAISYAKKWNAELLKFEEVVDRLDKGDINGPWRRYVFEPMAMAQYREFELNRKMTLLLNEAMEQMPSKMRRGLMDDVTLEGIGTVKRKYLLSMALNMGNESNQSKMLRGMGWADPAGMENVGKALDKLSREEWTFIQKTWDALESLWPEIAALEKRMTGLEPEKVERTPFTVALEDGTTMDLQGGYYPVAYDPKGSSFGKMQADADIMTPEGLYRGPQTFKGHTKERNEAANAPMLFDFEQVLSKHVPRVVKDVSHREAAMSVAKLLNNQEVRQSVQETLGPEYEAAMMPWLQGTVNDPAGSNTELASWLGKLRSNLVVASLAFRASSVLVQVMDPARAMVGEHAVKPQYMLGAAVKLSADLARLDLKTIRDIRAMSGEMQGRKENLDRDLRSMWKRNLGKTGFYAETQRAGMKGLAIADALTSTVVWLGAYDQAIAEGAGKDKAVRMADRVVRLKLMTGAAKDLTQLQRSPDVASKLLTTYMGDAVSVYGMMSRAVHNVANGEKIAASAFAFLMAGMILPVLADAVKGKAPEDDEDKAAWALRKAAFGLPSSIPLVRDVAGSMESGYDYSFSPIASQIAKIPRFAKKYSGDKDIDEESLALDLVDLVGGFSGLPGTGQAMTSLRYLKAVEGGRKPKPKSDLKKVKNVILGPSPEVKR